MRVTRPLALHPFLLAAVPVLALWLQNVSQGVSWRDVVAPLGVTLAVTACTVAVAWLSLRRNWLKAALVTSLLVVLFFAFGPVSQWVAGWRIGPVRMGHQDVVLALWVLLAVTGIAAVIRAGPSRLAGVTKALNFVAAGLVIVNLASIGFSQFRADRAVRLAGAVGGSSVSGGGGAPDIYYIVLDDYGGVRAFQDLLGYDNRPFLRALEQRGLYVVPHASTNYPRTDLSLASTLNMQYVDRLVRDPRRNDPRPLWALMANDAVPKFLHSRGYSYIHMGSWAKDTATNPQADINVTLGHGLSEFSNTLLQGTAAKPILGAIGSLDWDRQQYDRVLFQFDQLAKVKELKRPRGPKFVFGHILMPHWPFVVGDDGDFDDSGITSAERHLPVGPATADMARAYLNQVEFANRKTLALIDALLAGPVAARPVIVLQSDEGFYTWLKEGRVATDTDLEQHFNILNALYLPQVPRTTPYPTITPVNTFRLLFDAYFGAGLRLLPDRNYVQVDGVHLYEYVDVTARVQALV